MEDIILHKLSIRVGTITDRYEKIKIPIFITTTYDRFWTIYSSSKVDVKIPNNYPRFTTVEKAEGY